MKEKKAYLSVITGERKKTRNIENASVAAISEMSDEEAKSENAISGGVYAKRKRKQRREEAACD